MDIPSKVTFWIAVAGFIMSFLSWVHTFFTQRKNFDISILQIKSFVSVTYLYLLFSNKSRLPIAITNVQLLFDGKSYNCTPIPKLVSATEKKRGRDVIKRTEEYSKELPIMVPSLGAVNGIVLFEGMTRLPQDNAKHLTLLICTNRGSPVQKTLGLPEGWAAQRRRP